jgi:diguanylate cyclase (GGDEF)-like protein
MSATSHLARLVPMSALARHLDIHLSRSTCDLLLTSAGFVLTYLLASSVDAYEALEAMVQQHENWQLDEVLSAFFILPIWVSVFAFRRNADFRREMTHRVEAQKEAQRQATHDPLTGLPNRRKLKQALEQKLRQVEEAGSALALIQIDLDRFKPVNDLHGHAAGDMLLQQVAHRLSGLVREDDLVARLGGDEFAVLAKLVAGPEEAARIASRLLMALQDEFELEFATVQIGASLGIAIMPDDAADAATLHRRADAALYRAKSEGRGCYRFFEAGMDIKAQEQIRIGNELRRAIQAGNLEPHFQPLVDLPTGKIIGFEVLARWTHETLGQIPPAVFIPLAEDGGLITALARGILRSACETARDWPDDLTIAVNLSPLQLADRSLVNSVADILRDTAFPAYRLELELTESALVTNLDQAREIIQGLKAQGIKVSLDDFGTGYSSLSHLQSLPFDKIKIDASFVRSMTDEPESRKIVSAVVGLGLSLGMTTLAEGIEDEHQAQALRDLGCPLGQGWLYGRAMPAREAAILIAAQFPLRPEQTPPFSGQGVRAGRHRDEAPHLGPQHEA